MSILKVNSTVAYQNISNAMITCSAMFQFSLLTDIRQMLLSSKINRYNSFCLGSIHLLAKLWQPFCKLPFWGLSQNFGAIILATYFGMPNFGNFLSRKMATYFGMPNFGKKNGNLFFGMPNFGNLNLARKMAYLGPERPQSPDSSPDLVPL